MDEKQSKQGDPGRAAGALVVDGDSLVHSVRYYPYKLLELATNSAPGIGSTKFKAGLTIPQHLLDVPHWFICFSRSNSPNESDAVDAQMMGLTLSTIGNQVWAKLLREGANNIFSETVPQLYILCGASPGSQQLENFKKATLNFNGNCAEFAAQQQEWIRLAKEQRTEEQAICNILIEMPLLRQCTPPQSGLTKVEDTVDSHLLSRLEEV